MVYICNSMEKNDSLNDPFLRDLVGKSTLESPSDAFVDKLMEKIQVQPQIVPDNKLFLPFLKSLSSLFNRMIT